MLARTGGALFSVNTVPGERRASCERVSVCVWCIPDGQQRAATLRELCAEDGRTRALSGRTLAHPHKARVRVATGGRRGGGATASGRWTRRRGWSGHRADAATRRHTRTRTTARDARMFDRVVVNDASRHLQELRAVGCVARPTQTVFATNAIWRREEALSHASRDVLTSVRAALTASCSGRPKKARLDEGQMMDPRRRLYTRRSLYMCGRAREYTVCACARAAVGHRGHWTRVGRRGQRLSSVGVESDPVAIHEDPREVFFLTRWWRRRLLSKQRSGLSLARAGGASSVGHAPEGCGGRGRQALRRRSGPWPRNSSPMAGQPCSRRRQRSRDGFALVRARSCARKWRALAAGVVASGRENQSEGNLNLATFPSAGCRGRIGVVVGLGGRRVREAGGGRAAGFGRGEWATNERTFSENGGANRRAIDGAPIVA